YAQAATGAQEPDTQRALWQRAAQLALRELREPLLARRLYRSLLEVEPERARHFWGELEAESGPAPEAFEALCQLLHEARRFQELSEVLVQVTAARPEPALFSRLGRLQADELGDAAAAIASHLLASDARAAAEVFLRQASVYRADSAPALELAKTLVDVGLPE